MFMHVCMCVYLCICVYRCVCVYVCLFIRVCRWLDVCHHGCIHFVVCLLVCDLLRDIFCTCIVGGSHWTESTRRVSLISISVNVCHFSSFSLISIRHPRFFSLFFSVYLLFPPRSNVHFTLSVVAVTIFLLLIAVLLFFFCFLFCI